MTPLTSSPELTAQTAPARNPWLVVSTLGLTLMEACWLALLYQSFNPATASDPPLFVLAVFAGAFLLAVSMGRILIAIRLVRNGERAVLLASFLLLLYAGSNILLQNAPDFTTSASGTSLRGIGDTLNIVPGEYFLGAAMLWVLLRGTLLARNGSGTFMVQAYFKLGLVMFFVFSIIALSSSSSLPGLAFFVIFLFSTLMAMAAARVAILGRLRGGRRNPFNRGWFGSILLAVFATVGVGFSAALLATGRFLVFYQQVIVAIFSAVITLTLSPFFFILGLFGNTYVQQIAMPTESPQLPPGEVGLPAGPVILGEHPLLGSDVISPQARAILYWGSTLFGILIILAILCSIRVVYLRRRGTAPVEYVLRPGDWLEQLRQRAAARRQSLAETLRTGQRLGQRQRILAAAKIRRIYADLMELAVEMGQPRATSQTPLEFQAALVPAFPAARRELSIITEAYLKVRYGELPETHEEIRAVEAAWVSVQGAGTAATRAHQARMKEEARERRRMERN